MKNIKLLISYGRIVMLNINNCQHPEWNRGRIFTINHAKCKAFRYRSGICKGPGDFSLYRFGGRGRVAGHAYRSTDDEVIRPVAYGLEGRHDALLVVIVVNLAVALAEKLILQRLAARAVACSYNVS